SNVMPSSMCRIKALLRKYVDHPIIKVYFATQWKIKDFFSIAKVIKVERCFTTLERKKRLVLHNLVSISEISDGLHVITCVGGEEFNLPPYGTNLVASVGPDGILLVDAGFGSTAEALADTLKTLGNGNLKLVINTHYHGDHTFGNQVLSSHATIVAHRNVLDRMSGSYFYLSDLPSPNRPEVGFDDSLVIHFNGEEIHVVHIPPCHSNGDAYVYFTNSKVVAVADMFFPDEIPYIDLFGGGSVDGYLSQIKRFISDFPDDTRFIAAHGRTYTKDDLREYDRMLMETTDLVRQAAENEKTASDMINDSLLADFQEWNGQFPTTTLEAWIQTVYTDLSGPADTSPSICEPMTRVLVESSIQQALEEYELLKTSQADAYDFGEAQLNMLGYQLLFRQRVDDAMEIFKLNVREYPESFNVYDSYGEVLLLKGDTAQSIDNYEKSVQLNPDNTNAVQVLERLRGSG
ncbi:MAG: MBL fold metallo-hydrolase, partial [Candidatus Zixiibacteriota bacterium]